MNGKVAKGDLLFLKMNKQEIQKKNIRYNIAEGVLYISTGALLPAQTMMPALIKRLGGDDVLIGAWPIVAYVAFFLPQVLSANYSRTLRYRKPIVVKRGFLQRLHILVLACIIALWGAVAPTVTLILLFLIYISNQIHGGLVSPIWMDFFVKTTSPETRGKVLGWRTSIGAALGFVNGLLLAALLTIFRFPYNYASVIGLAFMYQMGSLIVQRNIIEQAPSSVSEALRVSHLFSHMRSIVSENSAFRKFLIASAFLTISFSSVAFFTVAAMARFDLTESVIGIFTVVTITGQIFSGILLGWIADIRGTKSGLILCGFSLVLAILIAWFAPSITWFYVVFAFLGINIGTEMFMRYNFAIECAPDKDRPMYVGLMNACFAPFYLITPLAGWLSAVYGYNYVFALSLLAGIIGIILLVYIPDLRRSKLALSSK